LINRVKTGKVFHQYINPIVAISEGARRVHGITDAMVADKPTFPEIVPGFLEFLGDSVIIIHNADFDLGFINHELSLLGQDPIKHDRVICTLKVARKKFPGSPASLDALCKRYNISLEERDNHGALLDAQLLTHVYINLTGGTQSNLAFDNSNAPNTQQSTAKKRSRSKREFKVSAEELAAHEKFLSKIKAPLWGTK